MVVKLFVYFYTFLNFERTSYDLVLGYEAIATHAIALDFASKFNIPNTLLSQGDEGSDQPAINRFQLLANSPSINLQPPVESVASLETNLRVREDDGDDIVWKDTSQTWTNSDISVDSTTFSTDIDTRILTKIYGDATLKLALRKLRSEFSDVFSRKLSSQPALLKPLVIESDLSGWHHPRNRGPPRKKTSTKEVEIEKQVNEMLALGLIRAPKAAYYSQVHLVSKPNVKWRSCIDYRYLNLVSSDISWPLPNISQTLQRTGARRTKYFLEQSPDGP